MKKVLFFISLLWCCSISYGQLPVNQTFGSPKSTTLTRGVAAVDSGYQLRTDFIDTSFANLGQLKNTPGLIIRTGSSTWIRNSLATRWLPLGYGVDSTGSSTLSNIGSGYRLAVPGTNNVKTLFAVNGLTLDSSSNANALTFKLGGTLVDATTTVDADNKDITISNIGLFQILGTGAAVKIAVADDVTEINGGTPSVLSTITVDDTITLSNLTKSILSIGNRVSINPYQNQLYIDSLNYTLSTTGKKIMLRDTASGLVQNIDPALLATTSPPISSLTAATGTNSINNGDYQQTWNWNSLSGYGFVVQSSATTASNGSRLFYVLRSGTNANAGVTSYSGYFSNSHIGTSSTNIAGLFSAQSGTNNYAIIVPSGGGSVGIGTTTPNASALLDVTSTSQGAVLPRMNTTQMNAISSPVAGLMVYNSDSASYVFYNGSVWLKMGSGTYTAGNGLTLSGSTFKLGGTLTDDTTLVNQDSKRLRFYGNETMFDSLRVTSEGESDFLITHRKINFASGPVVNFTPKTNDKIIAFDIMPRGNPSEVSGQGYAWIDVCDRDVSSTIGSGVVAARVGITSTAAQFGSKNFDGASAKNVEILVDTDKRITLSTTNTADFNIGKITQSQSLSGDFVGYYLLNTNNTVAESNPIFFIGNDIASNRFGYLRWNNNASAVGVRTANTIELVGGGGSTGGVAIRADALGSPIRFTNNTSGVLGESMRIQNGRVGIGTTAPDSTLHVVGGIYGTRGVRFSGLPSSTDTTTYKPVARGSDGTLVSMTSWPQQKINLVFGAGSGADSDTTAFTTSAIYGSFYNDADTIVVTSFRAVLQGTSPDVTYKIWYNDSLNVEAGATALVTAGSQVTNTTTGTNVTSFDVTKIPPGNWVWVKTSTVATKPKYFSLTINGYRK